MKVAVLLENFEPHSGGGFTFQKHVYGSLKELQKSDHDYYFVSSSAQKNDKKHLNFNFNSKLDRLLYFFRRSFPFINVFNKFESKLEKFLKRNDFDLAYFVTPTGCLLNFPYVATVWDLEHRSSPFFPEVSNNAIWWNREATFSWVLKRASFVITGTETGIEEITRYYGVNSKNIWKLPHPTPCLARSENDYSQKYPFSFFFYPAQFWMHKNHHTLVKAFAEFKRTDKEEIRLVLPGSDKGERKKIEALVKELGIDRYVIFAGFIENDELAWIYANSRGLVYASFCGPENLPPLEAISFNCPVAVADIPGAKEQFGDKVLFFNPHTHGDISNAMKRLLEFKKEESANRNPEISWALQIDQKINSISSYFR